MKIEETREAMIKAIRSVSPAGKVYADYVEELCDRLMSLGAFIPPAKIGDTVYAVLDTVLGEEPGIEPWEVKGHGVDRDGDLFVEGADGEREYIDSMYCVLDEADAEKQLAVYMQKYREKVESDEVEECLERIERTVEEDE